MCAVLTRLVRRLSELGCATAKSCLSMLPGSYAVSRQYALDSGRQHCSFIENLGSVNVTYVLPSFCILLTGVRYSSTSTHAAAPAPKHCYLSACFRLVYRSKQHRQACIFSLCP